MLYYDLEGLYIEYLIHYDFAQTIAIIMNNSIIQPHLI